MGWDLLAELGEGAGARVLAAGVVRRYRRTEVIFHEGDAAGAFHLIRSGHIAIRSTTPQGDTATLAVLGSGDSFGELALVGSGGDRTAAAVALDAVETLALSRDQFERLRAEQPGVDRWLVALLADNVDRLSRRLLEALYVGADRRIVRRLLEVATVYGGALAGTVVPLTQDDLAGLAGTTRPTVNQVLRRLEEQGGLLLTRSRIELVNLALLHRRAGL